MSKRQGKDYYWIERYNDWRLHYDLMDYGQHQHFWNIIEKAWPDQFQCKVDILESFIGTMVKVPQISVLELGGWKGEVAKVILESPLGGRIQNWINYEICPNLRDKQVCKDPRYNVVIPNDYFWNTGVLDEYDLFVCSHTIEHISRQDLKKVLLKLNQLQGLRYLYLEAPLPLYSIDNDWKDYRGSHKLEIGWTQARRLIEVNGWSPVYFDQLAGTLGAVRGLWASGGISKDPFGLSRLK